MTITICGSMRFAKEMEEWRKKLESKGYEVFIPGGTESLDGYKEAGSSTEATKRKIANDYIRMHYKLIKQSEAVLILNYEKDGVAGYIGSNSLMEMGFAFTLNRDIFLLNPIPEISAKAEIEAMQPMIINGDVNQIDDYYNNLPQAFLSSESGIKVKATTLALREYDLRYKVVGFKTKSGINEQPYSIEETYAGAENRLDDLKKMNQGKSPKLWISIESGDAKIHPKHNYFGLSVCIIEDDKNKRVATIGTDVEMPKEMTDLVPSVYPDLGVLVQQKYGAKSKDPYLYFTNGKLNRDQLIFNTVVNTLAFI